MTVGELQKRYDSKRIPVLCWYIMYDDRRTQRLDFFLGSLLKQLLQIRKLDAVPARLRDLWNEVAENGASFPVREIRSILIEELERFERVFLVVDALDESAESALLDLLEELKTLRRKIPKLSVMTTTRQVEADSRPLDLTCDVGGEQIEDIYYRCDICHPAGTDYSFDICRICKEDKGRHCKDKSHVLYEPYDILDEQIRLRDEDIEAYIRPLLNRHLQAGSQVWDKYRYQQGPNTTSFGALLRKDPELFESILQTVIIQAEGRILLAKLFLESIQAQHSLREVHRALTQLSADDIDGMYAQAIERVKARSRMDVELGMTALAIVATSERVLTVEELKHALAVFKYPDDQDFDKLIDSSSTQDILRCTEGLIEINGDIVNAHRTLMVFLRGKAGELFPNARQNMAKACLSCLNYKSMSTPCRDDQELDAREAKYPFLAYASVFWARHFHRIENDNSLEPAIATLVNDTSRMEACIQMAWYTDRGFFTWDVRNGLTVLHICAGYGLASAISKLDANKCDVDAEEPRYGQTPLLYAARAGYAECALALLDRGANPNAMSRRGTTPLFEAVERSKYDVVDLLVSIPALDVNTIYEMHGGVTVLIKAIQVGHLGITRRILESPDLDPNQRDLSGHTALFVAASSGHTLIVEELLKRSDIQVDLTHPRTGWTALLAAVEQGSEQSVELLLKANANPEVKDSEGGTALMRAADHGDICAMHALLKHGADPHCRDNIGRGILHGAALNKKAQVIDALSANALPVDAQDMNGMAALHLAARSDAVGVVEKLLLLRARKTIEDNFGRTPSRVAWEYGNFSTMHKLKEEPIQNGASPVPFPERGSLPLWSLALLEDMDLIKQAISERSDLDDTEPGEGNTALHWAVRQGRVDILRELLQTGKIAINHLNHYSQTALHIAAQKGDLACTRALLEYHVKTNILNKWQETSLTVATRGKYYDVAVALVEARANVGKDPAIIQKLFFKAVELGSTKAVKFLMARGADVRMKSPDGLRAVDLAKRNFNRPMEVLLKRQSSWRPSSDRGKAITAAGGADQDVESEEPDLQDSPEESDIDEIIGDMSIQERSALPREDSSMSQASTLVFPDVPANDPPSLLQDQEPQQSSSAANLAQTAQTV